MRIVAAGAILLAALGANIAPASATANWDYACRAGDTKIDLDVTLTFNQGTAGRITVGAVDAHAGAKDQPQQDATTFAADDIEQFWIGDDVFRISLSRYNGGEPEPAQLLIDTTCRDLTCSGTYRYTRKGITTTGKVACDAGEKG